LEGLFHGVSTVSAGQHAKDTADGRSPGLGLSGEGRCGRVFPDDHEPGEQRRHAERPAPADQEGDERRGGRAEREGDRGAAERDGQGLALPMRRHLRDGLRAVRSMSGLDPDS